MYVYTCLSMCMHVYWHAWVSRPSNSSHIFCCTIFYPNTLIWNSFQKRTLSQGLCMSMHSRSIIVLTISNPIKYALVDLGHRSKEIKSVWLVDGK